MRLILVRHGQTDSNVTRALDTGEPGAGLTELGWEQADGLVERFGQREVSHLLTSHLLRTNQTVEPLARALELAPRQDPRIREIQAGNLEMLNDFESITAYMTTIAAWMTGDLDVRMPGAEDGHEVLERFDAAVADLAAEVEGGTALVVSHGAIIRTWSAVRAVNAPPGWGVQNVLGNTDAVELTDESGEWMIQTWQGIDMPRHPVRTGVGDPGGRL